MNPIDHPGTMMLIHNMKVRDEMERGLREPRRGDDIPRPIDRNGPGGRMRRAVGHGLIALAHRIAPAEPTDAGVPAGAPH